MSRNTASVSLKGMSNSCKCSLKLMSLIEPLLLLSFSFDSSESIVSDVLSEGLSALEFFNKILLSDRFVVSSESR